MSCSTSDRVAPLLHCREAIELLGQPALLLGCEGAVSGWNDAAARVLGFDSATPELLSDPAQERLAAISAIFAAAAGPFMIVLPASDGERFYSVDCAHPGEMTGAPLLLRDDTELVQARRILAENERRFVAITGAAFDAMVIMDPRGRVCFWNAAAERIFGWSAAEVLGRDLHELLLPPSELERYRGAARNWSQDGRSALFGRVLSLPARHRDGRPIQLELSLASFRSHGEWQAFGVVRDATRRAEEEARLREAEERWKFALEGGGDAVWDWCIDSGEAVFGPRYKAMLGYAEDEFENSFDGFFSRVHPDDQPRVRRQLEEGLASGFATPYRCDFRMRSRSGEFRWIHSRGQVITFSPDGEPLRMVGTHRDITEQRAAEKALSEQFAETQRLNLRLDEINLQLVQSEKMASIGQLSAGIAHEMNTPLAFVGSNIGTLEGDVNKLLAMLAECSRGEGAEALRERLGAAALDELDYLRGDLPPLFAETREGIERVSRIVADLKNFSHVGEQGWSYVDVHRGLDSTLNIVRNEIKHKAEVVRDYGELPEIWCIPSQLNQVFMNLLVNAAQSIAGRGRITIRTRCEDGFALIEIEDTGCGIEADALKRIFEPFYTTKPVGKGTGLGLSISYGIVRRHGGRIEVASTPGVGSRFSLRLPLQSDESAKGEPASND